MSERRHLEPVEDYTNPFLVSLLVLVFMILFAIWTIWGILVAFFVSWVANRCIDKGSERARNRG